MKTFSYDPIYANFEYYFQPFAERAELWYPSGKWSIIVELNDGRRIEYYDISKVVIIRKDYLSESEWRKEFAINLKCKMWDACIDQTRLADKTGISQVSISNYLNRKATPSGWTMDRLARALDCNAWELYPCEIHKSKN